MSLSINKILLEHSQAHCIPYCLQVLGTAMAELGLQSLKYLLFGPFQENLPIPSQILHPHCGPSRIWDKSLSTDWDTDSAETAWEVTPRPLPECALPSGWLVRVGTLVAVRVSAFSSRSPTGPSRKRTRCSGAGAFPALTPEYTKVKDTRSILSEHLGEVGQRGTEMKRRKPTV